MKVAVIGGGMAGLSVAKHLRKLDKNLEIILIEPKQYFEVPWCAVRSLFDPEMARKSTFSIKKWAIAKSIHHIRDRVASLTDTEIQLSNGQYIEFNLCVICTGATTKFAALGRGPPNPRGKVKGRIDNRLTQLEYNGKKLLNAKTIAIIGGGLIGVELAGDLAFFANKQNKRLEILLIHNQERLVPEFTPSASAMAKEKLEEAGVQIIFNEKAVAQSDGSIRLAASGEYLNADEIIWTTGLSPVNTFMDRKYLDRQGWIKVDEFFRVKGAERLFAVGDCCDLLPNTGFQAMNAKTVLCKNILLTIEAMKSGDYHTLERNLNRAVVSTELYVATIGRTDGVALTPLCTTQFLLPWIKNSTMFLGKVKSTLGLTE